MRVVRRLLRPEQPPLCDRVADRLLVDTNQLGDLTIGCAHVEAGLRTGEHTAFELGRAARSTTPDVQRLRATVLIPLAILVYPTSMSAQDRGHLTRRGQAQHRVREHHRCEPQRTFVVRIADEDRTRGIKEGDRSVLPSHGKVLADHVRVIGKEGHAVLKCHESPDSP